MLTQEEKTSAIAQISAQYLPGQPYYRKLRKLIRQQINSGLSPAQVMVYLKTTHQHQEYVKAQAQPQLQPPSKKPARRKAGSIAGQRFSGNYEWKPNLPTRLTADERDRQQHQHMQFLQTEAARENDIRADITHAAEVEDAHEYVQLNISHEQMNHFRRWCVRTYGAKVDNLFEAVDAFIAAHPADPAPQPESIAVDIEEVQVKPVAVAATPPAKPKRKGTEVMVTSRPDQADFAASVRRNCNDRCVITGAALRLRTEAAHLIEHSAGGPDHWSNGLLLRTDIHELFDAGLLAICPDTLNVYVRVDALATDLDLAAYHGKPIAELRRPIDPANLVARWAVFQQFTV